MYLAVAASRRWALIYAFWQWFGRAPAGVGPLEVRFAHPVRLSGWFVGKL